MSRSPNAPFAALIDSNGWLVDARHRPSPNYDQRPIGTPVDTLVVHGISLPPSRFGRDQVEALFTNTLDVATDAFYATIAHLRVSAHVVIERTGRTTQYVGFDERAWHAGVSCFDARERVNDFAVGIELEGTDTCAYTPFQYRQLALIADALMQRYPALSRSRIVGHCDIAPGRKTDPGPAFDWAGFFDLLGPSVATRVEPRDR